MQRFFETELEYDVPEKQMKDEEDKPIRNTHITRNLINSAFQTNYSSGMDAKVARRWRVISKEFDRIIEEGGTYMILSQADFDSIYEEVYKCKYNPRFAFHVPVLADQLDKIKNRDAKKDAEIIKGLEEVGEAVEGKTKVPEEAKKVAEKVVEMSKKSVDDNQRKKTG